ncbi:hypothetical protein MTO96_028458 [Rhipicephalus appendiculatus]
MYKVFGLQVDIKRPLRFHASWSYELDQALPAQAEGTVISDISYKIAVDLSSVEAATAKIAQTPSVILKAGSTRADAGYVTLFYEQDEATQRHTVILEAVDDFLPLAQRLLTLWLPMLERSPLPGTIVPVSSRDPSET